VEWLVRSCAALCRRDGHDSGTKSLTSFSFFPHKQPRAILTSSQAPVSWLCAFVGASRQSKRRSTVRGRMTLRYSFRL
jgi:hypothetical protein